MGVDKILKCNQGESYKNTVESNKYVLNNISVVVLGGPDQGSPPAAVLVLEQRAGVAQQQGGHPDRARPAQLRAQVQGRHTFRTLRHSTT